MPGLERTRIVGKRPEELVQFSCNICLMILFEPMATNCCRQLYCKRCIEEWLREKTICPFDRKPLATNQLSPASRPFVNLLNDLKIKCDYQSNGCPATPTLEELIEHSKICEYNKCEMCGIRQNELKNIGLKMNEQRRHIERLLEESQDWKSRYNTSRRRGIALRCRLIFAIFIFMFIGLCLSLFNFSKFVYQYYKDFN